MIVFFLQKNQTKQNKTRHLPAASFHFKPHFWLSNSTSCAAHLRDEVWDDDRLTRADVSATPPTLFVTYWCMAGVCACEEHQWRTWGSESQLLSAVFRVWIMHFDCAFIKGGMEKKKTTKYSFSLSRNQCSLTRLIIIINVRGALQTATLGIIDERLQMHCQNKYKTIHGPCLLWAHIRKEKKKNDMTFSFLGTSQKKGEGSKQEEERSGGNWKENRWLLRVCRSHTKRRGRSDLGGPPASSISVCLGRHHRLLLHCSSWPQVAPRQRQI